MGLRHFWSIISSTGKETNIYDLAGCTLDVDLSGWVVQALKCQHLCAAVKKPHLIMRNLLLCICNTYHLRLNLIFISDGDAPKLKWQAMDRRARAESGQDMLNRNTGQCSRLNVYQKG